MTADLSAPPARQHLRASGRAPRAARKGTGWAIPFLIPAAAFIAFVVLVPASQASIYAFTNWDGFSSDWSFTGLTNVERLFQDQLALSALVQTSILTVVTAAGINIFGLTLALILNSQIKLKGLMRLVFFAPVIITPVVVANLWKFIYLPDGPLNTVLRGVGLGGVTKAWLGNTDTALWAIIVTIIWQFTGVAMVIYLAGLQNVPDEIVEAAHLDGAGAVRRFFSVVLPQLGPSATIALMLTLLAGLKTFDQVWIMTQGGPGVSTQTLSTAQYQTTFIFGDFAYGATFAVAISVIAIVLAVVQQWFVRKRGT